MYCTTGADRISVYKIVGGGIPPSPSPPVPSSEGCYRDDKGNRALPEKHTDGSMTTQVSRFSQSVKSSHVKSRQSQAVLMQS